MVCRDGYGHGGFTGEKNQMLFDLNHSLYIVISLLATVGLLILFSRFRSPAAKVAGGMTFWPPKISSAC